MVVAVATAGSAIVGATLAQRAVAGVESAFTEQLDLTEASFDATNETVTATRRAIGELTSALDGAATTALIVGGALEATTGLLDEVAVLLGEDVPATVDSFRATIPGLISTAEAIDVTLRAIDVFTVGDYDPEVPLDEAIADLDASIADLPDDLRAQAVLLQAANDTIVGVHGSMEQTAEDVVEVRAALTRAGRVLDEQAEVTSAAMDAARALGGDVVDSFALAGRAASVFGWALAASQVGSLAFGWFLFSEARKRDEGDDAHSDADEVGDE